MQPRSTARSREVTGFGDSARLQLVSNCSQATKTPKHKTAAHRNSGQLFCGVTFCVFVLLWPVTSQLAKNCGPARRYSVCSALSRYRQVFSAQAARRGSCSALRSLAALRGDRVVRHLQLSQDFIDCVLAPVPLVLAVLQLVDQQSGGLEPVDPQLHDFPSPLVAGPLGEFIGGRGL